MQEKPCDTCKRSLVIRARQALWFVQDKLCDSCKRSLRIHAREALRYVQETLLLFLTRAREALWHVQVEGLWSLCARRRKRCGICTCELFDTLREEGLWCVQQTEAKRYSQQTFGYTGRMIVFVLRARAALWCAQEKLLLINIYFGQGIDLSASYPMPSWLEGSVNTSRKVGDGIASTW